MMRLWVLLACGLTVRAQPVRVRIGEQTVELDRERYVAAVLGGESSVFRSDEALKAMAVAARTYAVRMRGRHSADGYDFCATTHCQRVDLNAITPRLEAIVAATAGELVWREGRPASTLYSLDCGGRTDHHESLTWTWSAEPQKIAQALARSQLQAPADLRSISIVERSDSGRAVTLALAGSSTVRISAESFRLAIGRDLGWNTIRSDLYEVRGLVFQGRGAGHGAGLCQRGADQMGVQGRGYREILAFYYPGTAVGVTARGISWQRMCGTAVCLQSVNPQQDRDVLATAERLAARLPWPVSDVEIRLYPDLDTFRDATGEPGWVAAHTSGRRIHLQPTAKLGDALERTLRHELLHVAVESQARADLPVWFREGLVIYLDGAARGNGPAPSDSDLRRTDDAAIARRAYDQAGRAVAGLVDRYGRDAVFGWLKRGLPPEVTRASDSHPATKSR
jgi:stage II sporulation protein D